MFGCLGLVAFSLSFEEAFRILHGNGKEEDRLKKKKIKRNEETEGKGAEGGEEGKREGLKNITIG